MRRFGTRRGSLSPISAASENPLLYLPAVGPFADNGVYLVADQPEADTGQWDQSGFRLNSSYHDPIRNQNITPFDLGGGLPFGCDFNQGSGFFVWCHQFDASNVPGESIADASGQTGQDAGFQLGGTGGSGGSGAGGGAGDAADASFGVSGGNGGNGNNGLAGANAGSGFGGTAGLGWALSSYAPHYAWPNGGADENAENPGGPGFGGAGRGGNNSFLTSGGQDGGAGGGGGGGGLVVLICNILIGGGALITATGGNYGNESDANCTRGSTGGGGAIYVATRKYDGGLTPVVSGGSGGSSGNAVIYAIHPNNSLQLKSFSDVWNYT